MARKLYNRVVELEAHVMDVFGPFRGGIFESSQRTHVLYLCLTEGLEAALEDVDFPVNIEALDRMRVDEFMDLFSVGRALLTYRKPCILLYRLIRDYNDCVCLEVSLLAPACTESRLTPFYFHGVVVISGPRRAAAQKGYARSVFGIPCLPNADSPGLMLKGVPAERLYFPSISAGVATLHDHLDGAPLRCPVERPYWLDPMLLFTLGGDHLHIPWDDPAACNVKFLLSTGEGFRAIPWNLSGNVFVTYFIAMDIGPQWPHGFPTDQVRYVVAGTICFLFQPELTKAMLRRGLGGCSSSTYIRSRSALLSQPMIIVLRSLLVSRGRKVDCCLRRDILGNLLPGDPLRCLHSPNIRWFFGTMYPHDDAFLPVPRFPLLGNSGYVKEVVFLSLLKTLRDSERASGVLAPMPPSRLCPGSWRFGFRVMGLFMVSWISPRFIAVKFIEILWTTFFHQGSDNGCGNFVEIWLQQPVLGWASSDLSVGIFCTRASEVDGFCTIR
ncbi:hypothetical protein Tco_0924661 [Tanacetum coccineum]|uniref:Uncharacterized protein n=1 Tax=Tanacetum coccineum TaxID=301880 RepID=A0ABQ5D5J0_9ASTR